MKKYKRIFTIVIDSFGAGEMPDAAQYPSTGMKEQILWDIFPRM